MSDTPFYLKSFVVKPLVAGLVAGILDNYALGNTNKMENTIFGASVVAGTVAGDAVSPYLAGVISPLISDTVYWSGKTISQRLIEISGGAIFSYAGNRFIAKNDYKPSQFQKKVGIVIVSQIVGELVSDSVTGGPVSYLI